LRRRLALLLMLRLLPPSWLLLLLLLLLLWLLPGPLLLLLRLLLLLLSGVGAQSDGDQQGLTAMGVWHCEADLNVSLVVLLIRRHDAGKLACERLEAVALLKQLRHPNGEQLRLLLLKDMKHQAFGSAGVPPFRAPDAHALAPNLQMSWWKIGQRHPASAVQILQ
jgi:hypothetical protein